MNQFGQIVIYPDDSFELNKTIFSLCDENEKPDLQDREAARQIFKNPYGYIRFKTAPILDCPARLFYAKCVNDWVAAIVIPRDWILELLLPLFIKFLLAWLAAIALIICVIFYISKRLNKPLIELSKAAESIGKGNFTTPIKQIQSDDEIGLLSDSFKSMQRELADYVERLKQTVAARERAEGELNVAKMIQRDILPRILPPFENCQNIIAGADLIPAKGIGGDLYDVFNLDDENLAIIIGDVSGKGVPAALYMAVLQTLQRSVALSEKRVAQMVTKINQVLCTQNDAAMFVTYWIGILNKSTGKLTYTNAGHNPPIIKRANGEIEELTMLHGTPLAVLEDHIYTSSELYLHPEDTLILYTDGVTEAFNAKDEMFDTPRLLEIIKNSASDIPQTLVREIENAVFAFADGFEQSDDITLLVVRYR